MATARGNIASASTSNGASASGGQTITRSVGFAILRVDKYFTIDDVVFAERGDLTILGARTLEGLSLVVDPRRKKLVAAGSILAA